MQLFGKIAGLPVFVMKFAQNHADLIREKTGLEVDAYFSASKINWILENVETREKKRKTANFFSERLIRWLVWKLTNGAKHLTDVSNASRTMIFNINSLDWDEELLEIFDIPRQILPEVLSSSEIYGEVSAVEELNGIKIAGIAGDQQAALFGQLCIEKGLTKNTYGTGCFMLQNIGDRTRKIGKSSCSRPLRGKSAKNANMRLKAVFLSAAR